MPIDPITPLYLDGGCSCGSVRYRLHTSPLVVHCCHCTYCQRETGSAFCINALIESDNVTLLPSTAINTSPRLTESKVPPIAVPTPTIRGPGYDQLVYRCPDCFIAVWSVYAGAGPGMTFVRAGTLDDGGAGEIVPDVHIYTSSKADWVPLPQNVPVYGEFYDPQTVWRSESLERFRNMKEKVSKGRNEA